MKMKPVKHFEGIYSITDGGEIFIHKKNKFTSGYARKTLYKVYSLCKGGNQKRVYVHRVVAEAFLPNPENKPHVNHIDGNPSNNHVSNLEWCTPLENTRHSLDVLGNRLPQEHFDKMWDTMRQRTSKRVSRYTKQGEYIDEFRSGKEAARKLGLHQGRISSCATGNRGTHGGFIWKFA